MSNVDYLIMFISSIISVIIEQNAFSKLSHSKFVKNKINIIVIIISGIIVTANIYTNGAIIRAIMNIIISLIVSLILFKDSISKTSFYTIVFYILGTILEIITSLVLLKVHLNLEMFDTNILIKSFFSFFILGSVNLICSIKYVNDLINKVARFMLRSNYFMIIIIASLLVLIVSDFKYIMTISTKIYIGNIILMICLIIILIFTIYNQYKVIKETEKTETLLKYMNSYEKIIDEDRINRHEMLNNLLTLKSIKNKNSKEFENTLDELIETYNKNGIGIKNIHKLPNGLKGILYYKLYNLSEKDYDIHINISKQISNNFKKIDHKDYVVICKLVGILLDNAIEAASKCKNKYILIESYMEDNDLIFLIENSFVGKIDLSNINKKYYSTNGKGRGIGLFLLDEFISKSRNISFERKVENKLFTSKIIINKK